MKEATHPKVLSALRSALRPLTEEEAAGLESSIKAEGCRDALVVWKERLVLVDGHHRLDICQRLGKPYRVVTRSFASEDEAVAWARRNNLARRNLKPDEAGYLRGLESTSEKKAIGRPEKGGQNDPISGKTAERLAAKHGVSPSTIKRDAAFAVAVDALEEVAPGAKEAALSGKLTRKEVTQLAKAAPESPKEVAVAVKAAMRERSAANDPKKKPAPDDGPEGAARRWIGLYREANERLSGVVMSMHRLGPKKIMAAWGDDDRKNALIEWRGVRVRVEEIITELEKMQP